MSDNIIKWTGVELLLLAVWAILVFTANLSVVAAISLMFTIQAVPIVMGAQKLQDLYRERH